MPYYFMRDTPLQAMEQLMMSQPGQKPRGGGIYRSPFHYTPKDVACKYCQNYDRKHSCRLYECTCLEERIEAGVLELNEFVRDCFALSMGPQLRKRMHQQFRERKPQFFLSDAHRRRWTHWRERCWRLSDRNKAALFLLTAYESRWRRMVWKCGNDGFDFQIVRLGGIEPELYSVYQAAKAIAVGCCNITLADLASPELVTDEAFHLITGALLMAKYYGFEYLAPHLMELDASLNELNDLAGRLAVLDETEQEAFDGLLRLEIQRKVESNGSILTMQDMRTLAVSAGADCCHVVGATSDAELGRFYAENGFMEELDGLSDDVFEMLDFGKIGKALRTGENGTFTRSGYVVKHSELVTAPPCAKELPEKPEYLFRLTLGLHPDLEDDRTVTLELPASAEALREVQKQLGADGWEGAMVLDYDGIIPQAAEFADLPMELDAFNDFAEVVEAMPSREKQIPKLKALLEHFEVTDLATAAGLAEHIGDYILTPEISSPQEAAIDELNFTMDVHSAELLLPHVNLFTYGNEIIKDDNAALTSYGLLHREDYQPMQTPVQETQEQAMTME